MAVLEQGGLVRYGSADELIEDWDLHICHGGLFLDAHGEWELRRSRDFELEVAGLAYRVRFRAEPVLCAEGKVGLQFDVDSEAQRAIGALIDQLRTNPDPVAPLRAVPSRSCGDAPVEATTSPFLAPDGRVCYASLEAFLLDHECHLSKGLLFPETNVHWKLGKPLDLILIVAGNDLSCAVKAEPVFHEGRWLGLDLDPSTTTARAIDEMLERVQERIEQGRSDFEPEHGLSELEYGHSDPEPDEPEPDEPEPADAPGLTYRAPFLGKDRVVLYASLQDFLDDHAHQLAAGFLRPDTVSDWPPGQGLELELRVVGLEESCRFDAQVLFGDRKQVGLQVVAEGAGQAAIDGLCEQLGGPAVTQAPEPGQAQAEGELAPILGRIVAPADPAELGRVQARPLSDPGQASTTAFDLIASIAAAGQAVLLAIDAKQGSIQLRFNDKGNLIQFLGLGSESDLIDRLARARLLSRSQQRQLLAELGGARSAESLVLATKQIKLGELWSVVRDQAVEALEQVQAEGGGSYRIEATTTGRRTGVKFGSLIVPWLDQALAALEPKQLESLRAPLDQGFLLLRADAPWPLSELALDKKARRLAEEMLDGTRTLSDALAPFPLYGRDPLIRATLVLDALGMLELLADSLASEEDRPEYRLDHELAKLDEADRFTQAGVHWSAHASSYADTLQRLEARFGPHGALARTSPEAARLCQRRLEMARQAMEYLEDRQRRISHRKQVVSTSQLSFSAELLFKQVELHLMKQNAGQARELLEAAIELDPKPEYRALLGRFRSASEE